MPKIRLPRQLLSNPDPNVVTVTINFTSAPVSPVATFCDLAHDKRIAFLFTKDDGYVGDYNAIFPLINGGVALDGVTYPGFNFSDGANGTQKWGYGFAINAGKVPKDGVNYTSWLQYETMLRTNNYCLMNHSRDHTDQPTPLAQLQGNEVLVQQALPKVFMRTIVLPSGLPGFVAAGVQTGGYLLYSSEGFPNSADGYSNVLLADRNKRALRLPPDTPNIMLPNRMNMDGWFVSGIVDAKAWIDQSYAYAAANPTTKMVFSAFSHSPFTSTITDLSFLNQILVYLNNHPSNVGGNEIWVPNPQQLAEYYEIRSLAQKSPFVINGTKATFNIDLGAVPSKNKWQNMSLKVTGGTFRSISVRGADSFTYNSTSGLLNIYRLSKKTRA